MEADTDYKEEIYKHCLGQEMRQAFCVRNAKAQLQLRITEGKWQQDGLHPLVQRELILLQSHPLQCLKGFGDWADPR